jgi:hypothetical protein
MEVWHKEWLAWLPGVICLYSPVTLSVIRLLDNHNHVGTSKHSTAISLFGDWLAYKAVTVQCHMSK